MLSSSAQFELFLAMFTLKSARSRLWCLPPFLLVALATQAQTASVPPASPPSALSYRLARKEVITDRLKHFSGSDQDREQRIKAWFLEAGCPAPHIVEQNVGSGVPPNVICTIPGESESVILVGAHFDYVKRGEGVVDNWSGASLLPSFVSTLVQSPRHHTFVLIAFTSEEKGLFGSEFYAKHLTPEERNRIAAVINLDTLGLGPTEVWATHSDPQLVGVLNTLARAMNLPLSAVNVDRIGSTDSESFAPYKIPRITIHSITQATLHLLHSSGDQFSAIHLDDYYATYRLLTAYLVALDVFFGKTAEPPHASPAASPATPANTPQK
jgi:hypothetical protein